MTARSALPFRLPFVLAGLLAVGAPAWSQQTVLPELAMAQVAVQRATEADADQYAPDLISAAREGLLAAQAAALDRRQRKQAPLMAQRVAADADLARVVSEEAIANADLKQRRAEIAQLQHRLGEH